MSREIKFRAWIPSDKLMLTDIYDVSTYYEMNEIHLSDRESGARLRIHPGYIMQFTGLLDKNGAEIYEGDILVLENHIDRGDGFMDDAIARVYYVDGGFNYMTEDGKSNWLVYSESEGRKVVGNVYENGDLVND